MASRQFSVSSGTTNILQTFGKGNFWTVQIQDGNFEDVLREEMFPVDSSGTSIFSMGPKINPVGAEIRSIRLALRSGSAKRFLRRAR